MEQDTTPDSPTFPKLDEALQLLDAHKDAWAQTTAAQRVQFLEQIKDALMAVSETWVATAARKKLIPDGSTLVGEEWLSGPYALMGGCNLLIDTLSNLDGHRFLKRVPLRERADGQVVAKVAPHDIFESLLLSGVEAEIWMKPGVTKANLPEHTASAYKTPAAERTGKVALVLGAGNIASITPLDCFQKLFAENQVVLLKMNPINDYLAPFLEQTLAPLIEFGALRIVRGGRDEGEYLCNHPLVSEIHITGAERTHDAIVWGTGDEAKKNRAAGTPRNTRRITSELGAVCPTIVVPGPWTPADIRFQSEQIATQKLHNSGFNCIACQVLVLPQTWNLADTLLDTVTETLRDTPPRGMYYPGTDDRLAAFRDHADGAITVERGDSTACIIAPTSVDDDWMASNEVFAPALSVVRLPGDSAEDYLVAAVDYANTKLRGTLGANILIHPSTIRQIGEARFEDIVADLRYGAIAINAWTGLAFLTPQCTWGAFPGHTLDDIQSGMGVVHNGLLFDSVERTVVTAPFRPFPRTALSGGLTMLPRPPWFVTNRTQHKTGELLTRFLHRPSWFKLPGVFFYALQG